MAKLSLLASFELRLSRLSGFGLGSWLLGFGV